MATTAETQAKIDEIDAILESGVTSASINGRNVTYDLDFLERKREKLVRSISSKSGGFRRVVFKSSV